jgi:hypothetical protein
MAPTGCPQKHVHTTLAPRETAHLRGAIATRIAACVLAALVLVRLRSFQGFVCTTPLVDDQKRRTPNKGRQQGS